VAREIFDAMRDLRECGRVFPVATVVEMKGPVPAMTSSEAATGLLPPGTKALRESGAVWHCAQMCVCAVLLGSIGMLLGARLDFGQLGLAAFAGSCRVLEPGGLESLLRQTAVAPATTTGMLVGCNLAMALSTGYSRRPVTSRSAAILRFVACNAGMILGMSLAEIPLPGSSTIVPDVPADVRMLSLMMLGMAAGMWGGWWLAEGLRWGWSRSARLLISRHLPTARN